MKPDERRALTSVDIRLAPTPDDLWIAPQFHVDRLHSGTAAAISEGIRAASTSTGGSPQGVAILGQRGAGKSHLLAWVRQQIQAGGGYFFPVSLLDASAFWSSCALSMIDGLFRPSCEQPTQMQQLLDGLTEVTQTPAHSRAAVCGHKPLTRAALDNFVEALRLYERSLGLQCQDTARALVLLASNNLAAQDVAYGYLNSLEEEVPGERAEWGMRRGTRAPQEVVRDLSFLLATTGPIVITVDQIDVLIAQSAKLTGDGEQDTWQQGLLLEQIAGGLMTLRELTRRTLTVVACLPLSWQLITEVATDSVRDRFRRPERLANIPDAALGLELVEKRLSTSYSALGFHPPYPTWPISAEAFERSPDFTPRQLLALVDAHIRNCLANDHVIDLRNLQHHAFELKAREASRQAAAETEYLALDSLFELLRASADVASALAPGTVDSHIPRLLTAGLQAWVTELGTHGDKFSVDPTPTARPALHGRLRQTLDDAIEDEQHWSFRAIPEPHHVAVINRIRAATTFAGLAEGVTKRRVFLLRSTPWPAGPRTRDLLDTFHAAGGITLDLHEDDLRTLAALHALAQQSSPNHDGWLRSRQPAHGIAFLQASLPDSESIADQPIPDLGAATGAQRLNGFGQRFEGAREQSILVGLTRDIRAEVHIPVETLRQHVAIFAGSGSGKTMLLRRTIEECALQGISSIVLDPNNYMARLGEPWPTDPQHWSPGDAGRAAEYHAEVDVTIWTPRRPEGNDLSFEPIPNLDGLIDDRDEFDAAIDSIVNALAARAKCDGDTTKAVRGRAVLREALVHYIRGGGHRLTGFVDLLTDLPERLTSLDRAEKLASELSHNLAAAMLNDPLLSNPAEYVSPAALLTPPAGKRARVSVISMVGLPSDDQRSTFVNNLQMSLFAWIRHNPAGEQPMRGLLVLDEAQTFVPSDHLTACSTSTLALASQGRKYGLGMVFATQAPRGIHNGVAGNSATQFFGLLNSPMQIATAREIAGARGFEIPDISRLATGEFYASVKGQPVRLIRSQTCLTHHPVSPLTAAEVVSRAQPAR